MRYLFLIMATSTFTFAQDHCDKFVEAPCDPIQWKLCVSNSFKALGVPSDSGYMGQAVHSTCACFSLINPEERRKFSVCEELVSEKEWLETLSYLPKKK